MGATGQRQYPWTTRRTVDLGVGRVTHSFLVIPECPVPLLGRDLLTKMGAQISFEQGRPEVSVNNKPITVLTLQLDDEYRLYSPQVKPDQDIQSWLEQFPQAWAETAGMGLAKQVPPQVIQLKASATPVSVRQYPLSREAREGIWPHVQRLIQ
nr:pol protein [Porcine endogenous retrovirus A]